MRTIKVVISCTCAHSIVLQYSPEKIDQIVNRLSCNSRRKPESLLNQFCVSKWQICPDFRMLDMKIPLWIRATADQRKVKNSRLIMHDTHLMGNSATDIGLKEKIPCLLRFMKPK